MVHRFETATMPAGAVGREVALGHGCTAVRALFAQRVVASLSVGLFGAFGLDQAALLGFVTVHIPKMAVPVELGLKGAGTGHKQAGQPLHALLLISRAFLLLSKFLPGRVGFRLVLRLRHLELLDHLITLTTLI